MSDRNRDFESVTLTVSNLPLDVAEEVRTAQLQDPELLRRILTFGMRQKVVYETLRSHSWGLQEPMSEQPTA